MTMAKISRRAGMVAALLATSQRHAAQAVTATCASQADSQIIYLVRLLLEAIAEEEQLLAPYYRRVGFTYPPDVETQLEALAEQQTSLRQQIAALPATGMHSLQAKGAAVLLWLAPNGEAPVDVDDPDARIAWSLCRDLLKTPS